MHANPENEFFTNPQMPYVTQLPNSSRQQAPSNEIYESRLLADAPPMHNANSSFSEDVLNFSGMLQASTPNQDTFDIFDKFFIKFDKVAADIESTHEKYPKVIGENIMEKLSILRRDTGKLSKQLKAIQKKNADQIDELEKQGEHLGQEIVKLKKEVDSLVLINSKLYEELNQKSREIEKLKQGPSNPESMLSIELEDETVSKLKTENVSLKQQVQSLGQQLKKALKENDELLDSVDNQVNKYNTALMEQVDLEAEMRKRSKSITNMQDLLDEVKAGRIREVKK